MVCSVCLDSRTTTKEYILADLFPEPQEVLEIRCFKCKNLLYGVCKNVGS